MMQGGRFWVLWGMIAFGALSAGAGSALAAEPQPLRIVRDEDASDLEVLAAREIVRYVYLRTGRLLEIHPQAKLKRPAGTILVATQGSPLFLILTLRPSLAEAISNLKPEEYLVRYVGNPDQHMMVVAGGNDVGTLYGAYRLIEHFGVRFFLHGDVVPEEQIPLRLPEVDEHGTPLFKVRGIQPFHDFPEGPDWWNLDDYLAIISQLPKLRWNFIGLHTYPEGHPNAEPTVWIGPPEDIGEGVAVRSSYPASYQNTLRGNWGYQAKPTGSFAWGTSQWFERDAYGAEIMSGRCPRPDSPEECNALFRDTGALLGEAFRYARRLGVLTCAGTEVPLTVPDRVAERLGEAGLDPDAPEVRQRLYEGIFRRIEQSYPLDYYWFWTPEGWTWQGTDEGQVAATVADLNAAIRAHRTAGSAFRLATCGWVLGPQGDRALFDTLLPEGIAMSCINREVGKAPVDPAFAEIQSGRPKWAIPWLEDDPALTSPQLWVGRMRRDAYDARRYGCTGLLGIHWRTRNVAPMASALARAAWDQSVWIDSARALTQRAYEPDRPVRFPETGDFYLDWAQHLFGREAATAIAAIFARIDGRLPRPSDWVDGPGGLRPDQRPWDLVESEYAFVEELAALDPQITGAGHHARFQYWLDTFRYMKAMARLQCIWGDYTAKLTEIRQLEEGPPRRRAARDSLLPLRLEIVQALRNVYSFLLATAGTTGELGTIANWEQHILPELLEKPGRELEALLGESLPSEAEASVEPAALVGPARIIVPTVRTSLRAGESLHLKAILHLRGGPARAELVWRPMGKKPFYRLPMHHLNRSVYEVELPAPNSGWAIEYYLESESAAGQILRFPVTAPAQNQSVIWLP